MNKLLHQIIKFGIVGVLCFCIDFAIVVLLNSALNVHYMIATFFGFTISVMVNYLLSMKYVFTRKEELDRKKEFAVFLLLSLVGMGINTLVLWLCVDVIYAYVHWVQTATAALFDLLAGIGIHISSVEDLAALIAKCVATGIVMVYNFISRKIFLEKKEDELIEHENS